MRQDRTIHWRKPGFPDFTPTADHSVILVSWQDAERFCRWLSEKEGRTYRPNAYARAPRTDPQGPRGGLFRAIRGGGWFNGPAQNRAAQRIYFDPRFRYCLLSGFRVLLEAPAQD